MIACRTAICSVVISPPRMEFYGHSLPTPSIIRLSSLSATKVVLGPRLQPLSYGSKENDAVDSRYPYQSSYRETLSLPKVLTLRFDISQA